MLIYGAGGHAKVVTSILFALGGKVSGVFDDGLHGRDRPVADLDRAEPNSVKRPDAWFPGKYDARFCPNESLIIAIGNNDDRRKVSERIVHSFGQAIHPSAVVDGTARTGEGIVIVHNAIVQADCLVGSHVIINTAAIIDHECILANFVHIGPGATLCGGVRVGECTLVGAGSVILPGIRVGKECMIGAGSVVTRDVPDCTKVAGNPARRI